MTGYACTPWSLQGFSAAICALSMNNLLCQDRSNLQNLVVKPATYIYSKANCIQWNVTMTTLSAPQ